MRGAQYVHTKLFLGNFQKMRQIREDNKIFLLLTRLVSFFRFLKFTGTKLNLKIFLKNVDTLQTLLSVKNHFNLFLLCLLTALDTVQYVIGVKNSNYFIIFIIIKAK